MSNKLYTKHGLRYHPLYKTWLNARSRCYGKHIKGEHWKGRNIQMQENWRDSPVEMIAYLEKLPNAGKKGYSLDR